MKAVLISIQPKWCELIASRRKTIEVRKTRPKIETPFKCYIYCTEGKDTAYYMAKIGLCETRYDGKVIGEFVCDRIDEIDGYPDCDIVVQPADLVEKACLTQEQAFKYLGYGTGFGWHISKLKIYYRPKELGEFKKAGFMTEEQWLYALYPNTHCHYAAWAKRFEITRPPQSWCYVEDLL